MRAGCVSVIHHEHFITEHTRRSRSLLSNSNRMVQRLKKKEFLNKLPLSSQLPMGQTVVSVFPCTAFCFLKVSILFWIITFSWNRSTTCFGFVWWDFFFKKSLWIGLSRWIFWTSLLSEVSLMYKAMPFVSRAQSFQNFFILPLYSWRSVIVALFLAFTVYNIKKAVWFYRMVSNNSKVG